jgi:hypothetical protein
VLRRDVKIFDQKYRNNRKVRDSHALTVFPLSFRFFFSFASATFLRVFVLGFLFFVVCAKRVCVTTILHVDQRTLQSHFLFNKKQDDKEIPVDLHVCERVLQKKTREREKERFRFFFL